MRAAVVLVFLCCPAPAQESNSASRAIEAPAAASYTDQLSALHREATQDPACRERLAEDFVPMTLSERLVNGAKNVAGSSVLIDSALSAGFGMAIHRPKEWGRDVPGFAERFGSAYAQHFISEAIQDSIAFKLHEDNRYFASGKQGVGRRLAYVLESTLMARHDDGTRSVSVSALTGTASAAFLSRAWQPHSTSEPGNAAVSFGFALAMRALRNGLVEFAPRLMPRFMR